MPSPLKHLFPVLGIASYGFVWQIFIWNGAYGSMSSAIEAGAYPDGTAIRKHYTGVTAVDNFIAAMVAFNYPVTIDSFSTGRLFLAQFLANILVLVLITQVEGYRPRNRGKTSQLSVLLTNVFFFY